MLCYGPDSSKPPSERITEIPASYLAFNRRNPRLALDLPSDDSLPDEEIIEMYWNQYAIKELVLSIAHSGYFPHEPLIVKDSVVIDGNRRLAAVLLLTQPELREKIGVSNLPEVSEQRLAELSKLPAVILRRGDAWETIGYRHINGTQGWQAYQRACWVAWVHTHLEVPLPEISRKLGDESGAIHRLYQAYLLFEQASKLGIYKGDASSQGWGSFLKLYCGVQYENTRKFLGVTISVDPRLETLAADPVPSDHIDNFAEWLLWLTGDYANDLHPVVKQINPHIRQLDAVLGSAASLSALRGGAGLRIALQSERPPENVAKEKLDQAVILLQDVRRVLNEGNPPDSALMVSARDILDEAAYLVQDLEHYRGVRLVYRPDAPDRVHRWMERSL